MEHPTFIGSNCGSPENCSEVLPENLFYGTALRVPIQLANEPLEKSLKKILEIQI